MPRCCGVASRDEARIPCNGRAPCVRVLKSKPVKKWWNLWCGVDFALGFCFDYHFDNNSLQASNCQHHPWGMIGETVLKIVREHRQPGTEDSPFANVRWAMDNWFMSKPLYGVLLRLRQYPYGTMELK
eukprot:13814047-Ditylum_brightwellii.AAC.1